MRLKFLMFAIAFVYLIYETNANLFYTSNERIKNLIDTSFRVNRRVEKFFQSEKDLEAIRPALNEWKRLSNFAIENPNKFVANPINSYFLIKQLTVELNETIYTITDDRIRYAFVAFLNTKFSLPDMEDHNKAIEALFRVQDIYQFTMDEFYNHIYNDTLYKKPNAHDYLRIGRYAFKNGDSYHAVLYLQEAENLFDQTLNKTEETSELFRDIYDKLSEALSQQKNPVMATKVAEKMLELDPDDEDAESKISEYLVQKKRLNMTDDEIEDSKLERINVPKGAISINEILCRGDPFSPDDPKPKHCRYMNRGPYFLIAPLKEEVLSETPLIYHYPDFLSHKQADALKKAALPKLKRSGGIGENDFEIHRLSHSALLDPTDNPVVAHIDRLTSRAADLSLVNSEKLYVANYGLAGYYEDHRDYFLEDGRQDEYLTNGNRIASWLFVLEAADKGGRVTFPGVGLGTVPEKGSAYFWYNLAKNGEPIRETSVMFCPVIEGHFWTSSKWYRAHGQEFKRPCSLQKTDL